MAKRSTLEKIYKVNCENGYYLFKLNSILNEKGITKNKIINKKAIDFNSMQRLIKGELTRIDLNIIAKLCNELDCKIDDLIEYKNNGNR